MCGSGETVSFLRPVCRDTPLCRLVTFTNLQHRAPETPEKQQKKTPPGCGRNTTRRLLGTTSDLASSKKASQKQKKCVTLAEAVGWYFMDAKWMVARLWVVGLE